LRLCQGDLIQVRIDARCLPRVTPVSSIPDMLFLIRQEWDNFILENYQLRQQVGLIRRELAHSLLEHDAACRVIARLIRELHANRSAIFAIHRRSSHRSILYKQDTRSGGLTEVVMGVDKIRSVVEKGTLLTTRRKQVQMVWRNNINLTRRKIYRCLSLRLASMDFWTMSVSSHDRSSIIAGGQDGQLKVLDIKHNSVLSSSFQGNSRITSLHSSRSVPIVVSTSLDRRTCI